MKKLLYFVLCMMALCISLVIINNFGNEMMLNRFSRQLDELPPHTKVLMRHKQIGDFGGNGDGYDFLASAIIKTELSFAGIKEYYENQAFNDISGTYRIEAEIIPMSVADVNIEYEFSQCTTAKDPLIEDDKYIIQLSAGEYSFLSFMKWR